MRIRSLTSPSKIQSWLVSVHLPADGPVSQPTDPPRYSIRFLFITHTYKKYIAFSPASINFTDYLPYIWYNTSRDKIFFLRKTISRRNKTTEWLHVALGLPTIHEISHNRVLGWENIYHCQQLYDTKPYLEHGLLLQGVAKAHGTISRPCFHIRFSNVWLCENARGLVRERNMQWDKSAPFFSALSLYNTHITHVTSWF